MSYPAPVTEVTDRSGRIHKTQVEQIKFRSARSTDEWIPR